MENKKLPVGIENFKEIRKEGFYYVDKTGLIRELLNNWGKANLFTRPRRFGKTLNMSMLKSFFEIGAEAALFDGLEISKEEALCETYMGKFPVVFVSLKSVDGLTFEDACGMLRGIIRDEVSRLSFLLHSNRIKDDDKRFLERFFKEVDTKSDVQKSLKMLSSLLYQHYCQKIIILIDEYDVPLDKAFQHGYYAEMVALIRSLFGAALKTNDFLHFAVLTGCLRVLKESIFTGLNNFKANTIFEDDAVQASVQTVAEALGSTGRVLVRESGTEPVIRVMVEAESQETFKSMSARWWKLSRAAGFAVKGVPALGSIEQEGTICVGS